MSSATWEDLRDELIAGMPEGESTVIDYDDADGPGPLFAAHGKLLAARGTDQVDELRREITPLEAVANIPVWERSLALDQSRTALSGTTARRRAQVLGRLRERGAPTKTLIQTVLNSFLNLSDPSQIQILQTPRQALRDEHTYRWSSLASLASSKTVNLKVLDDAKVSASGAQVDVSVSIGDVDDLTVTVTDPGGLSVLREHVGRPGAALASPRTWAEMVNPGADSIFGMWGLDVVDPIFGTHYYLAWAVGANGTIQRFDGSAWGAQTSPVATTLRAVWGRTATNVWAVGLGGVILRWNGTVWSVVASGVTDDLYGIWGSASGNIWAVGAGGVILHWDGTSWTSAVSPTTDDLYAVWGSYASDVWAVGESGRIVYYNGGGWANYTSPTSNTLLSVWGTSTWDAWACGVNGTLIRLDVTASWKDVPTGLSSTLYAGCKGDVLADGSAWPYSTSWIVGASGEIRYWDGQTLSDLWPSTVGTALYCLWRHNATDILAGGAVSEILRLNPSGEGLRLYFAEFAGRSIAGTWTVTVQDIAGSGVVTDVALFVEGIGLDSKGLNGRGSTIFHWGAVADPALLGSDYDLDGARAAVQRLSYARDVGELYLAPVSPVAAGELGAVPDDANAIPDAAIPG